MPNSFINSTPLNRARHRRERQKHDGMQEEAACQAEYSIIFAAARAFDTIPDIIFRSMRIWLSASRHRRARARPPPRAEERSFDSHLAIFSRD